MSTPFQIEIIFKEAFDLTSCTTILGVAYGIVLALYGFSARSLYLQLREPEKQRHTRFTLGFTSFLLFCTTATLVLNAGFTQLAYVNHASFPGGPQGYETSYNQTTKSYQTVGVVLELIIEASTMAIQIWRLRIVWSGTPYTTAVTIPPIFLLFSYIDTSSRIVIDWLTPDQMNLSLLGVLAIEAASYAVLSTSTVLVTGLIITRLLIVRRHQIRVMGASETSSPYVSIATMLIESYTLDSAWSIGSAISIGIHSPSSIMFDSSDSTIKVIAYFLIVYRVSSGRGRTRESKLTSLQWNHGQQAVTGATIVIGSQIPATTDINIKILLNSWLGAGDDFH